MTTVAVLLGGQNITTTKLHMRRVLEFEKKLAQVCEGLENLIHEMVDRTQQGMIYSVLQFTSLFYSLWWNCVYPILNTNKSHHILTDSLQRKLQFVY